MFAQRSFDSMIVAILIAILMAVVTGYVLNVVKVFTDCTWEPEDSFGCEIIRPIGVLTPPLGVVLGYLNFEESK